MEDITQPGNVLDMMQDAIDICFEQKNGHTRTPDTPITGVCDSSAPEWVYENIADAIDPDYEEYLVNNPDDEYGDEYYNDEPIYLIGFIRTATFDEYEPDPAAEYSAIVGPIYTQVVKSKWISRCVMCSMCYPNQGDLSDMVGYQVTYTLPPEVWGDAEHLPIEEI